MYALYYFPFLHSIELFTRGYQTFQFPLLPTSTFKFINFLKGSTAYYAAVVHRHCKA